MRIYEDFELLVERHDGRYRASVLQAPARKGATEFEAPFSREELDLLIPLFSCTSRDLVEQGGKSEEQVFREAGAKLFQSVFSGQVLNCLQLSLAEVKTRKMGLRLRLRLSHPEAALWPWEYLYDSDGKNWLALLPHVTIVRDPAGEPPVRTLPASPPLRVLVFIAGPQGQRPTDSGREWSQIERGVRAVRKRGRLLFTRLEHGTLQSLLEALGRKHYHVLHFIGHGSHGPDGGVLIFEGRQGDTYPVSGRTLAMALNDHPTLRLVVLNSCDGAKEGQDDFTSVAETLVRNDIPAVVAMRAPVSNRAAVSFARHFYPALVLGRPLEEAMTRARKGMVGDENQVEWGTPVLYLRAASGDIIRWPRWLIYTGIAMLLVLLALGYQILSQGPDPREPIPDPSITLRRTRSDRRCPTPPDHHIPFKLMEPPPESGLQPFCIGFFEVTQGQWRALMGDSHESAHPGPDRPVDKVSREQAREFARRLNRKDPGGGYRLPLDKEWSYAAGASEADTTVSFMYGNCATRKDDDKRTTLVGEYQKNQSGLYDMVGNVREWVDDDAPSGKGITRGGSWSSYAPDCALSAREDLSPTSQNNQTGFRIVRDPLPVPPQ